MITDRSARLWAEANRVLAGGVNSPVRAFRAVGGHPFFARSGRGPRITDADGNRYIDYVLSWGPLIAGHAHPAVVEAVTRALRDGSSFGIPTEAEVRLAERIIGHFPSIERLRLVNSGTEAALGAIRLARGATGRDVIVKVEGGYHGQVDSLLIKAGSGPTTFGTPTSPGVPAALAASTLSIPFNDLDAAREALEAHGSRVACLILEPVPGNMGVVLPGPGYLQGLRDLTAHHGALLVFDEVMSGFRVALGGAQSIYGVRPDLTMLGKVIGGGLPAAAFGGRADLMDLLSPTGPVYQAGTLSGNPLATAAGLATLEVITAPGVFDAASTRARRLIDGLAAAAGRHGVALTTTVAGTMGGFFFHGGPVRNYLEATASDTDRYTRFFWSMLAAGVYFAPSQFEALFLSTAHGDAEIEETLAVADRAFASLAAATGTAPTPGTGVAPGSGTVSL
jgi:glutamate-1-semialdehyde 2,1-aminomutase